MLQPRWDIHCCGLVQVLRGAPYCCHRLSSSLLIHFFLCETWAPLKGTQDVFLHGARAGPGFVGEDFLLCL